MADSVVTCLSAYTQKDFMFLFGSMLPEEMGHLASDVPRFHCSA
jgi:hypothetical protein